MRPPTVEKVLAAGDKELAETPDYFGQIAANFELTPEQMERQLSTSLVGPMNVTRAVLPVMRKQRSGQHT